MKTRIICRTIILNEKQNKLLLVRNRTANFWYPPGGGLEEYDKDLKACAKREAKEEVGIDLEICNLQYIQEFCPKKDFLNIEFFWLTKTNESNLDPNHIDLDQNGMVEEARWIDRTEIAELKVYPKRLKDKFWEEFEGKDKGALFLMD